MPYILRRADWRLPDSAATDEGLYRGRRAFLKALGLGGMAALGLGAGRVPGAFAAGSGDEDIVAPGPMGKVPLPPYETHPAYADAGRPVTRESLAVSFNNFYEFSFRKEEVREVARDFIIEPYHLVIDGLVEKPLKLDLHEIEALGFEERVYRFRCVEAWAMTVPWLGVPLAKLIEKARPADSAKYVAFYSHHDPEVMPNQRDTRYNWPYYEGLRMDEALHELSFVSTGMYGKRLLPQSGTPLRIIVPWKYGFKGGKSVVRMTLTDKQPRTFWNDAIPDEYGFLANVEPEVAHPRWSQRQEWRLDTGPGVKYDTEPYNGYAAQVAGLYR